MIYFVTNEQDNFDCLTSGVSKHSCFCPRNLGNLTKRLFCLTLVTHSVMSLMYSRNNKGPRMVPCGVPEVTDDQSEHVPLTTTRCMRPIRKCLSQFSKQPLMPLLFSFNSSCSWGTLSKALARSKKDDSWNG